MNAAPPIRVLLAAESVGSRELLLRLLQADPRTRVVAVASQAGEALELLASSAAQVLLMDVRGHGRSEIESIARVMQTRPLPLVVCGDPSAFKDTAVALGALKAGAVACVDRPDSESGPADRSRAAHLIETIKLMAEVRVVRRHVDARRGRMVTLSGSVDMDRASARPPLRAVGIGASTGGPPVLQALLGGLPPDFPVPVLVVQHIAPGFLGNLAQMLAETTPLQVRIGRGGDVALAGHVYLAPDDAHMGLDSGGRIVLSDDAPEKHVRPSVSFLFRSLAQTCGAAGVGVLLTGMGRDGADELKLMRDAGAVTIAQDRDSSVVHGMAGAAIARGAASLVLPAARIAPALAALAEIGKGR